MKTTSPVAAFSSPRRRAVVLDRVRGCAGAVRHPQAGGFNPLVAHAGHEPLTHASPLIGVNLTARYMAGGRNRDGNSSEVLTPQAGAAGCRNAPEDEPVTGQVVRPGRR